MSLFPTPYARRTEAHADLAAAFTLAVDTIELVALRERRCLRLADALRHERDALEANRADADEAEALLVRAAGRYEATRRPARPCCPTETETTCNATSANQRAA